MPSEFDDDTALEQRDGTWHGCVTGRWHIIRGPNGGYVASFPLRAMANEAPFPDPLTMTTHFMRSPTPGPVQVTVETLRTGRSHATLEARMTQDGLVAIALATFGTFDEAGTESIQRDMPQAAPPDESAPLLGGPHEGMTIRDRLDQRIPSDWPIPGEGGKPVVGGWCRLPDRALDALAVPLFMDTWPPAMFNAVAGSSVPTLELTIHWRSRPHTNWHLARFRSLALSHGYVDEEGELWGEDGRLVAQSRQLALFIPPP